ncbi:MAG: AAA family ATPase [Desulfobacteraceae bacterium]|nr:AAA family ATPase [Desulfobacteraceae bacterium]
MSYIIALSGSHGTGKTTAALLEARQQKIQHPDKSIAVLCEQASLSPYPINKEGTEPSQMWIFTRQIEQELAYLSKYDIIISDRTAVDAIAYTYVAGFHALAAAMFSLVENHISVYQKIIFNRIITNDFWHQDGIRETTDSQYRQDIETKLIDLYRQLFQDDFKTIMELN